MLSRLVIPVIILFTCAVPATYTRRRQSTRLAFMNAFLQLVIEHGFDRITVTDIANAADYGRWTFYQYFESKEAVAWAVFEHWMTQLDAHLVTAVEHLPPPQCEYQSWRLILQAFEQQKPFIMRLDSVLVSRWRERAKEFLIAQFLGHLHAGRFALMTGVRPEIAARLYVTAMMELLTHWGNTPDLGDAALLVDEFYTFIFNQSPPAL